MFRLVALACVLAACSAQNVDPKNAKILKEQRFNAGDGRAGSAFATEDGVIFREEADASGNRIGQYSYIGDDGTTYTVKYSAGKDGFRILSGDHVPADGNGAAPFVADPEADLPAPAPAAPIAKAAPRPAAPRPAPLPIQRSEPAFPDYDDAPVDPNFNPFINPNDPTHLNFNFNKNAAKFNPNSPIAQQQSLVPPCADCEGVNPFINPFDASHQGGLLAGHLAGHRAGIPQQPAATPVRRPTPNVARPAPRPQPQPQPQPQQFFAPTTTASPRRFFPPGQLSLNRFETGFNFDFES